MLLAKTTAAHERHRVYSPAQLLAFSSRLLPGGTTAASGMAERPLPTDIVASIGAQFWSARAAQGAGWRYKALLKTVVRVGFEMTSRVAGKLEVGTEIVSLDQRVNSKGVTRVQFKSGWVSAVSGAGAKILQHDHQQ